MTMEKQHQELMTFFPSCVKTYGIGRKPRQKKYEIYNVLRNCKVIDFSTRSTWTSTNPFSNLRMKLDIEECHFLTKNSRPDIPEKVSSLYVYCVD